MMGAIFMLLAVRNITPAGLLRRSEGRVTGGEKSRESQNGK